MHDGGTIDVFAPFGAFSGACRDKNYLIGTVDNKSNSNNNHSGGDAINAGSIAKVSGGNHGVEPQQLDKAEFNGGSNSNSDSNDIADNVDGFLDEFLALVDSSGGGEGMDDFMDIDGDGIGSGSGDIAEEGLGWLEDMDLSAFLPPPANQDAAVAGSANIPLPSSAHEITPLPKPAVGENRAAEAATPMIGGATAAAAAASQAEGSPPRAGGEVLRAVGSSATAAGASPSSAGSSAAGAANAAPVFAGGDGGAGRNGHDDGGAVANNCGDGGCGSVDGAVVSRKEQLRRQKVARYLAKKKNRQWSKAKASSYQSRQRVANSRPRHKGRFLPLESDFVSVAELQRRQRALMKQMQEKAAAAKATAVPEAGAPSVGPMEGGGASSLVTSTNTPVAAAMVAAASGNVSPLSPEFGNQVAI